jgi:hypothetical protein
VFFRSLVTDVPFTGQKSTSIRQVQISNKNEKILYKLFVIASLLFANAAFTNILNALEISSLHIYRQMLTYVLYIYK